MVQTLGELHIRLGGPEPPVLDRHLVLPVVLPERQGQRRRLQAISGATHTLTLFLEMVDRQAQVVRQVALLMVEVEGLQVVEEGLQDTLTHQLLIQSQLRLMVVRVKLVAQATRQELEEQVWPVVMVEQAFLAQEAVAEQEVQAVVRV